MVDSVAVAVAVAMPWIAGCIVAEAMAAILTVPNWFAVGGLLSSSPYIPGTSPPPPVPPPLPLLVPTVGLASGSSLFLVPGMICGLLPGALP